MEAIYAEKTLVRQKPPLHPPHTTVYPSKTLGALRPIFWSLVEDHPRSGRYQTVPLMSFVHVWYQLAARGSIVLNLDLK
jgi:hypothetical protein